VIGDLPVEVGDYVQAGQDLTQLIDNDSLDLNLNVPQERSGDVRRGLPVEIITGEGDTLQTGQISFISPQVDADSRFIQTEVSFSNEGGQLRDGQFVRTEVIWERRPNRVVVPQTAVVYQGDDRFVYVPQEQDEQLVAQRRTVELGLEQGSQVEIISGLQPHQQIVVSGIQKIADGAPIRPLGNEPSGHEDSED
jgi:RND family efflux transporter MFP subunit